VSAVRFLSPLFVLAFTAWATPAWSASRPSDREGLRAALQNVVERTALKSGRVSIEVRSLEDGALVYSKNADDLLNPASNVKLFTAAAALAKLGPDYRFSTELFTDAEPNEGKVKTLYVRGLGDPTLTTERLYALAGDLFHAGLREAGELVIDETFFDGARLAPGFDQETSDHAYMAPTGAVSLNSNAVGLFVHPGERPGMKATVEVEPPSDYVTVDCDINTSARRNRRFALFSEPFGDKQKVIARGVVPSGKDSWSAWKKVDNPPQYFGQTFKALLNERGIKLKGRVRLGTVPQGAKQIYVSQSDTLDLVLKRLNKNSSNFIAEQLLKTLGAELVGVPGTTAKGVAVVEDFLEKEVGIPRGAYVMKNGSGLNDTNRFSAAQLVRLLHYMWDRFPLAPEYLSSLGIAGKDGTVRYRFEGSDAVGRLRAKTGTLENVSALSGYVQTVGGEKVAFAMLVNDYPGRAGPVVQGLDALGAALAASGSAQGPDKAVAQWMTRPTVVGTLDELRARVKTYLAMHEKPDKKSQAFLRTAWRTEADPAVRAVVADALYRSDTQDYLVQRTLLDSLLATDDVYGRLRQVALQLSIPVPGVASVLDLAAEGNLEALSRAVELSRAASTEDAARKEMEEGLAEVARTAPDELLLALRKAQAADREAALDALAKGLVGAADADHPFWPSLKKAMGAPDPEAAAFAQQVEAGLSIKIAADKAPMPIPGTAAGPASMPPPNPTVNETRPGGGG